MTPCPFGTSAKGRGLFRRSGSHLLICVFLSPSAHHRVYNLLVNASRGVQLSALSVVVVPAV